MYGGFVPKGQPIQLPEGSEISNREPTWELWINRRLNVSYLIRELMAGYMVTLLPGINQIGRNTVKNFTIGRASSACCGK